MLASLDIVSSQFLKYSPGSNMVAFGITTNVFLCFIELNSSPKLYLFFQAEQICIRLTSTLKVKLGSLTK